MTKKTKFFLIVVLSLISIILVGMGMSVGVQTVCINKEKLMYPAPGKLIEVDGKKMHVYEQGKGKETIVLLTGLGTVAPVLDFEPLIQALDDHYKVVVVEPFGYGWSEVTAKSRTVENMVRELRTALKVAEIEPPYILMPHSISGIYSLYYAHEYPEEVKAIVGLDPALPAQCEYFGESLPQVSGLLGSIAPYLAPSGLIRLATNLIPEQFLPVASEGTYTTENLMLTKKLTAWHLYNESVVGEAQLIGRNLKETMGLSYPKKLPVLIFSRSIKETRLDGKTSESFYEIYLKNLEKSEFITLDAPHYLHWKSTKEISQKTYAFLESLDK